jgi:excisionase family DNA binding protein
MLREVLVESSNIEGWLSINEVARYLNLSVSFIRKQVRYQRIPFVRPGGKVLRFRRDLLDAWLESNGSRAELSKNESR